jgi:hypothetical protein
MLLLIWLLLLALLLGCATAAACARTKDLPSNDIRYQSSLSHCYQVHLVGTVPQNVVGLANALRCYCKTGCYYLCLPSKVFG